MLVMAARNYPVGKFDSQWAMKWLHANVRGEPDTLLIRTQNALAICLVRHEFMAPSKLYGDIPVIIGRGHIWEAVKLARVAKEWAKTRHAKRFIMSSDEDVPDVGAIARRIGLKPYTMAYQGDI